MTILKDFLRYYMFSIHNEEDTDSMDFFSNNNIDESSKHIHREESNGYNEGGDDESNGENEGLDNEVLDNPSVQPLIKDFIGIILGLIGASPKGGDSSNGGISPHTGITSKDYSYVRTDISYLFKWIIKTALDKITDYTTITIITTKEYTHNIVSSIGSYINTALASITPFIGNISTFTECISVWAESYSIYLYIGGAILHVGFLIWLYKNIGCIIRRSEYLIEKSIHYFLHFGKTLICGDSNRKLPSISPIDLVSMDIMYSVPTATINNLSALYNPISALSSKFQRRMEPIWYDTPLDDVEWLNKDRHIFRLSTFQKYKKFLGLKCFGNLNITKDTLHLCNFYTGLKSICDHDVISHIVQVRTLTFSKISGKYIWGMFYVLVTLGVGVVVWYKFIEGGIHPYPLPVGFLETPAYDTFKNPYAYVNGYDRVTYFIRNDSFLKLVLSKYYVEPPMDNILPPIEDIMRNKHYLTPHYASISTAITIATFIAANMLVHGTGALMQQ